MEEHLQQLGERRREWLAGDTEEAAAARKHLKDHRLGPRLNHEEELEEEEEEEDEAEAEEGGEGARTRGRGNPNSPWTTCHSGDCMATTHW
jgi:hypothetical protein